MRRWDVTAEELTQIIDENPSLRGFIMGYVSENKVHKIVRGLPGASNITKYDDHDRTRKGDISFFYRRNEVRIEVKSLQTNSIRRLGEDAWKGTFQCDASDRREIILPNGRRVNTTCLAVGEFDIVAVNLFSFGNKWRFAYAKNSDLPNPSPRSRNIPEEDKPYLIATSINISWPLQFPFTDDLQGLLDEMY